MCNSCKKNSPIKISVDCITVEFNVTPSKIGSLKRTTDFSATQKFDPDNYLTEPHFAICTNCGKPVDLNNLQTSKSCYLCGSTEILHCDFNNVDLCVECASLNLRYCKSCPYITKCVLGEKNVSRNSR